MSRCHKGEGLGIAAGVAFSIAVHAPIVGAEPACGDWSVVDPPVGSLSVINVEARSADDAWAVGYFNPQPKDVIRWDGTAWSRSPTVGVCSGYDPISVEALTLFGPSHVLVSARASTGAFSTDVGECDVWAVGNIKFGSEAEAFIERLQAGGGPTTTPLITGGAPSVAVFPNPVRHSARIHFAISGDVPDRGHIYNVRGRRVRALFERPISGNAITWDGRDDTGAQVPGGVYFLRIEANGGDSFTKKLTIIR